MENLRRQGCNTEIYNLKTIPIILVLSKRYDPETLRHALVLRKKFNTRIYLDICDNHFFSNSALETDRRRASDLDAALQTVDTVIVSTDYLAEIVTKRSGMNVPVKVIGDLVEFPQIITAGSFLRSPIRFRNFLKLKTWLNNNTPSKIHRLVWFGNHGNDYVENGMSDVTSIRSELESIRQHTPISLTIISNNKNKFLKIFDGWKIPTQYYEWNEEFISAALALHGISIIPIITNPFTNAKSSNRIETSIVHGLEVIAQPIPSYLRYADSIWMNDWLISLQEATSGKKLKKKISIEEFRIYNRSIINKWVELLSD